MIKLDYLKRYHKDVNIINITDIGKGTIDKEWEKVFLNKDMTSRKEMALNIWKKNFEYELSRTISYLEKNIQSIDLISYGNNYSILYGVTTGDGEIDYYEGGNPSKFNVSKLFNGMPEKLKIFYTELHNGFFYYPSRMMGITSINEVTIFSQDEWGIIDDLEEPIGINIESTYGFFKSGMGGYLAIDYSNCENDNATLWFTNKQPRYNVDFWDIVDEWILMSFE